MGKHNTQETLNARDEASDSLVFGRAFIRILSYMKHRALSYLQILWERTKESWSLDTRSLSLFRVGLALIVLADLLLRSRYIVEHYTDGGIYTRSAYQMIGETVTTFSLHAANGQLWYQIILFLIHGFFALWLLF